MQGTIFMLTVFVSTNLCVARIVVLCPQGCECENNFDDTLYSVTCTYADMTQGPPIPLPDRVELLDLSNNKLTRLSKQELDTFSALETLYLSTNEISEIEADAFTPLKKMRNIDLSYNELHYIDPGLFAENSDLETLNLRGNPLVYVPKNSPFIISQSIISLDLSLCKLTSLDPLTFSQLPSIRVLDLSSNHLRELRKDTLEILSELSSVDLENNLWNCDCEVADVLQWVTRKRRSLQLDVVGSPVKCIDRGAYKTLWTLAKENKSCDFSPEPAIVTVPAAAAATLTPLVLSGVVKKENPKENMLQMNNYLKKTNEMKNAQPSVQSWWDELFSWNVNTILVFIVLPLTLGIAIFITLIAVNYVTNWMKTRALLELNSGAASPYMFSEEPLVKSRHLQDKSRLSLDSLASYHIYERIK